ncbi:MAG TPA: hypothetical protein VFN01_00640 [Marinobacter sp.]|uniref:hypothetical protein n=1 Tax=Marinobacter sp. TaxID=50741 RepID=UPI002D7E6122|nr:hypothetical protein [Marinobacter sp.]HET8799665.1 hypothetical protein [Marinobacter sp.]
MFLSIVQLLFFATAITDLLTVTAGVCEIPPVNPAVRAMETPFPFDGAGNEKSPDWTFDYFKTVGVGGVSTGNTAWRKQAAAVWQDLAQSALQDDGCAGPRVIV